MTNPFIFEHHGGGSTMPRIKGRRPETTRGAVLEAAVWAFAEYGFENATLATIAHKAGVTAATLPYHFTDKQGLWDAVIESFYKDLLAFATTLRPDEGPSVPLTRPREAFAPEMREGFFLVPRLATHEDAAEES